CNWQTSDADIEHAVGDTHPESYWIDLIVQARFHSLWDGIRRARLNLLEARRSSAVRRPLPTVPRTRHDRSQRVGRPRFGAGIASALEVRQRALNAGTSWARQRSSCASSASMRVASDS